LLVGALLGSAAGLCLAAVGQPKFQAQITIVPAMREGGSPGGLFGGGLGGLAALAGVSPESGLRAESLATLRSRMLSSEFIRQEQLTPLLFADKWDQEKKAWKENVPAPTEWEATEFFRKKILKIEDDRKSPAITLTVVWTSPQDAASWANKLVALANEELRLRAKRRAEQNAAFLQDQLSKTSVIEIRQSIYTLLENEIKTLMLTGNGDEYAFKVVDPAVAPQRKVGAGAAIYAVLGFAIGFALCAFAAVLLGGRRPPASMSG